MTTIAIGEKEYNIKCTMGVLCRFQAKYGEDYLKAITDFDNPLEHPQKTAALIDVMTEEGVSQQIETVTEMYRIAGVCIDECMKFFEWGKHSKEGEQEEGKAKNP